MKLQILVPQYKETEEIISPLLQSLALQQHVSFDDFSVIIVNDGSDVFLSDSFLSSFPYEIKYVKAAHKGVSATRNAALDLATADYVMFCDADDMFFNLCGLYIIFREMTGDGFTALISIFVEETIDPAKKETIYINREMDTTFVHGKVYKRQFLNDHKIRFNDALTIHEDSYFNSIARVLAGEVKYCPQTFYLWKWRDESVCRHDPKYLLKTFKNMLDSNTALVKEFQNRGRHTEAGFYCVSMIYDSYYMMNKEEWLNQENQEYRHMTEKRFKKYLDEFKPLFDSVDEDTKRKIIVGMKNRFFTEGVFLEKMTFDDWMRHVQENY